MPTKIPLAAAEEIPAPAPMGVSTAAPPKTCVVTVSLVLPVVGVKLRTPIRIAASLLSRVDCFAAADRLAAGRPAPFVIVSSKVVIDFVSSAGVNVPTFKLSTCSEFVVKSTSLGNPPTNRLNLVMSAMFFS